MYVFYVCMYVCMYVCIVLHSDPEAPGTTKFLLSLEDNSVCPSLLVGHIAKASEGPLYKDYNVTKCNYIVPIKVLVATQSPCAILIAALAW